MDDDLTQLPEFREIPLQFQSEATDIHPTVSPLFSQERLGLYRQKHQQGDFGLMKPNQVEEMSRNLKRRYGPIVSLFSIQPDKRGASADGSRPGKADVIFYTHLVEKSPAKTSKSITITRIMLLEDYLERFVPQVYVAP